MIYSMKDHINCILESIFNIKICFCYIQKHNVIVVIKFLAFTLEILKTKITLLRAHNLYIAIQHNVLQLYINK